MTTYMGIAEHRTFDGKKYEYHSRYRTKQEASQVARNLREKGTPARVIPIPKEITGMHPGVRWLLYSGWTMSQRRH